MFKSLKKTQTHSAQDVFSNRLQKIVGRGLFTSAVFGGLILSSIFLIDLEGAIISPATITPEGDNKLVQHREGGTVERLLVKDGDIVKAGQWLVVLNNKAVQSEYNVLKYRRIELEAKLARLKASLVPNGIYPEHLLREAGQDAEAKKIVLTQMQLLQVESASNVATENKLVQRIASIQSEITALDSQIETTSHQARLIEQQIQDIQPLVSEQLVPKAREWDLQRALVTANGQLESLNVSRVRLESSLADSRNELTQFNTEIERETYTEIEALETELLTAVQGYDTLRDKLNRHVVKAPVAGKVHELEVFNAGGVIRPGETVMKIVPQDQEVLLSAKVKPVDIDQVYIGQSVRVRFDVFDANKTPEIYGIVRHIGADMSVDEQTGLPFFGVKIAVEPEQTKKLGPAPIVAGMPVTAMMRTESRSLFSYLTKPLADHSVKAFQ